MVADSRLVDHLDAPTQGLIPGLDQARVLGHGHHIVGVPNHMDEPDLGLGQRGESVHRVAVESECLRLVCEAIVALQLRPVTRAALAGALTTGPTLEIAHGRVAVNARHAFRVLGGKAVGVETTAADAHQGRLGSETATLEHLIERLELFQCPR